MHLSYTLGGFLSDDRKDMFSLTSKNILNGMTYDIGQLLEECAKGIFSILYILLNLLLFFLSKFNRELKFSKE